MCPMPDLALIGAQVVTRRFYCSHARVPLPLAYRVVALRTQNNGSRANNASRSKAFTVSVAGPLTASDYLVFGASVGDPNQD